MKILVCTDGSENSRRALEEASKIAGGCNADNVSIIHVYDPPQLRADEGYSFEDVQKLFEKHGAEVLAESAKVFEEKNIKINTILKKGHPAQTISKVASDEDFDMVVIGCRGVGGLKSILFGSTCNAVAQLVEANVVIVK